MKAVKRCADCINLSVDGRQCNFLKFWFPVKTGTQRAKDLDKDTFYCAVFAPRKKEAQNDHENLPDV